MKNPLAHISIEAPFSLIKSLLFHHSKHVSRHSVSREYLGLCAYIHANTSIHCEEGTVVEFRDRGFLVLGTERSSFRGWAGRPSLHLKKGSRMVVNGYNQIGRGSLLWLLEGGELLLGGNSYTAGLSKIIAKQRVEIGRDCKIAWGVTITDHDFHESLIDGQDRPSTKPVKIGDGVWIGMDAKVLKGVSIGDHAIVAAGAVVTHDVPAHCMVAGVPARIIRQDIDLVR